MRGMPVGAEIDANQAATLVTHLTVRTAYVRDTFTGAAETMLNTMGEMASTGNLATLLGVGSEGGRNLIFQSLQKELAKSNVQALPAHLREWVSVMAHGMAERMASGDMNQQLHALVAESIVSTKQALKPNARESLGAVLFEHPAPEKHVARLRDFHWSLHEPQDSDGAILPDCVAITYAQNGRISAYMGAKYSEITTVALPIASNRVLVGSRNAAAKVTNADLASCSDRAFIASLSSDALRTLVSSIGMRPPVDLGDEHSGLIGDLRAGRIHDG